jgi:hypothetical protein
MNLISGDNKDGIYQGTITLTSADGSGIYNAYVSTADILGNSNYLNADVLSRLGFPAQLQVIGTGTKPETTQKTRKRTRFF